MDGAKADGTSRESGYRALIRVTGLLERVMQPYFSRFGISRSQWACLRILHRAERESGAGLRPVDLGRLLLLRPPSITGLIDRLKHLGLVMSTSSAIDARGKEVRLTIHGRRLVERVLTVHADQIAAVMGGLDVDGQQQLNALLQTLAAHLQRLADAGIGSHQDGPPGQEGSAATPRLNQNGR